MDSDGCQGVFPVDGDALDRAEWLATILAHSADIISILDLEGTLVYLNRGGAGRDVRELVGKKAVDFLAQGSRKDWEQAVRRAIDSGKPQELELISAASLAFRARIVPILRDGRVAYLMSIGTDVTTERQTESALRVRDGQLRLALEASGMGQWWWNVPRDEVVWDSATKRIFGFDQERDDFNYSAFLSRIHPEDVERVKQHVAAALETGSYAELESRVVLPDGNQRWALMTGRVVHDTDGKATDLIGGIVDITQSKTSEAQLRRTQKLEAIGQLAGGVAHDFNNLLVAIMGNVELARRASDETQRQSHLVDALTACSRAADLTRQLLAFGRKQQLHQTVLDVNEVIADTMNLLRRLLPESITVDIVPSHAAAHVQGDRGQLEQVLVNLCVNARDAMPDGGRLVIRVSEQELEPQQRERHPWARAGRHVVVSVNDTGSGIAPELIERVFEPFFTTKQQGTGLGLASAYGIIKQHGGVLHVESDLGVGTTFALYLPRAEVEERAPAPDDPEQVRGGSELILVAEDDSAVSYVVRRILEGAGYRVLAAEDGARAVELFRREHRGISLVLLDSVMPELSGAEVALDVRALRPDVGIILSIGYLDALVEGSVPPEFDDVVPKPYEPDELLRAIRGVLDSRGSASPKVE